MLARARQHGLTIIELMTALIIAGVLVTIAAPAFNDMFERRRLEGSANELVIDLQYAKSEAVQRNRNVMLRTDPAGTGCYTIAVWTSGTGDCNCTATPRCTGGPTELKTVTLANGATVTSNVRFDFEPVRGALEPVSPNPSTAASAVIALGARSHTVSVTAYGRVTPFTP
jgi:prepilin-type N-terminal cleavage/methylation domain-containing protein